MILVDTKTNSSKSSSPLNIAPQESQAEQKSSGLSFSELLRGASDTKTEKVVQQGVLVLALDEKGVVQKDTNLSKKDRLLSLLKGSSPVAKESQTLTTSAQKPEIALNPTLVEAISPKELKVVMAEAKEYLKNKIVDQMNLSKSEIEALPKTLKGLVDVATKIGIDVSKITLEEFTSKVTLPLKSEVKIESKVAQESTPTNVKEQKPTPLFKAQVNREITTEQLVTTKLNTVTPTHTTVIEPEIALNPTLVEAISPKELKVVMAEAKEYLKNKIVDQMNLSKSEIEALPKTLKGLVDVATKIGIDVSKITLEEFTSKVAQESTPTNVKEQKPTPLFKAQVNREITTEQLVTTKLNTVTPNPKTPKEKADDTLKMLLQGIKGNKQESSFTADFSVATAKVIAPTTTQKPAASLESLLRGDTQESTTNFKVDGLNVNKADSLEVKLNEAKQMTKYLSQDVKTAIEDYKAPFTRVKVALNPERLGSVELTVVQRGKNLHINLSSNNAAINALAMNVNDLKVQLNNSGINNATLNFNNNSQSSEQGFSGQQQQNSQNERSAREEYNYFDNEEKNEEILNSLEIVVPNYA